MPSVESIWPRNVIFDSKDTVEHILWNILGWSYKLYQIRELFDTVNSPEIDGINLEWTPVEHISYISDIDGYDASGLGHGGA